MILSTQWSTVTTICKLSQSTAIAFGRFDLFAIACCQLIALAAFTYAFALANLSFRYFCVFAAAGCDSTSTIIKRALATRVSGRSWKTTDSVLRYLLVLPQTL